MPGNPRYQPKELVPYFGYDHQYVGLARVEIANLEVLAEIGVINKTIARLLTPKLKQSLLEIRASEVDEEERAITKHDVRAWVHVAQSRMPKELGRWVHVPLTSYDAIETGRIWTYRAAYREAIRPAMADVIGAMARVVRQQAQTKQIGRTHGQHALPITVGFWLAGILNRLVWCSEEMDRANDELVGKISGAVGANNATVGLGFEGKSAPKSYEQRVLEKLGLRPAPYSTQILPPERLAAWLFSVTQTTGVLGQLGRDGRSLVRTEIGELREPFRAGNVGSSTMAHKRNPITFEGLEGAWIRTKNEFGKVMDTTISEHQRDLVGSSVMRDFPILPINLMGQLNSLRRRDEAGQMWLERVSFDLPNLRRNFEQSAGLVLAEPLYIALQMAGFEGDSHRFVSDDLVTAAVENGRSLVEELIDRANIDPKLAQVVSRVPKEILELLGTPENYLGKSKDRARKACDRAENYLNQRLK
jgi:adenylosuccinate lyase